MKFLKDWRARIVLLLAVIGPGFITANVDNDAGGIFTYSQAGAQFGYSLLWTMIPITIALVVVQEMASRMGAVTGKGLSDLIREEFGFRVTFWLMLALIVTNFGNVVAEFAGVASSLELFGWSKYLVVPVAAAIVWALVVRGTYDSIEKIFLAASGFYVCYIVAGLLAHPDWKAAALATFSPPSAVGIRNYGYLFMVIALVGTTIGAGMQFYLPGAVVATRDDDRAVDAVLPAGVDRREGDPRAAVRRVAVGRDPRLSVHGHRRLVHHRRLRGDPVRQRPQGHRHQRRRRGGGAAPAGRRVCVPAVRRRAVQRVAVRRVDPADLDGLRGVRGAGLRIRPGQEIPRGAGLLLALHAADRLRRRRAAGAAAAAGLRRHAVAGRQRHRAAAGADFHAD